MSGIQGAPVTELEIRAGHSGLRVSSVLPKLLRGQSHYKKNLLKNF